MKRTHGKRGQTYSRPLTISGASKEFAKDRVTLHRWIRAGVLKKCDKQGTYTARGKFVWGADVYELLGDPDRKRGKPLLAVKPRRLSKWQEKRKDTERAFFKNNESPMAMGRALCEMLKINSPDKALSMLHGLAPVLHHLKEVAGERAVDPAAAHEDYLDATAESLMRQKPQPSRRQRKTA